MELWQQLLFLCPMLMIAGIIDGISGGGGLIALPSYLLAGLPVTNAYACNKMQSCLGTSTALAKYASKKLIDIKIAIPSAIAATAGAYIATETMLRLSDTVKNTIIVVSMCLVIVLTILSYRMKIEKFTESRVGMNMKTLITCLVVGLMLGLYDGFFGPGGGTIAIFLFAIIMKYDLRVGCGNGKFIIVIANLTSLIMYIAQGYVIYAIAIPCSLSNMIGGYIGATLATKKGTGFVKYVSWVIIGALLIYTVIKLLF